MSLNDKIANELNHFLKIITYKDEAEADESLTKLDKEKSIGIVIQTPTFSDTQVGPS